MTTGQAAPLARIVILGATGDLTRRYLLPALAQLLGDGELPPTVAIAGVGRRELSTDAFRSDVAQGMARVQEPVAEDLRDRLLERVTYVAADFADPASLRAALGDAPVVAYLALPPAALASAVTALQEAGLHPDSRIVVEKPFGHDGPSARALNDLLHRTFPERNVFRIDHFQHHQTVQNILGLRFANRLFEPLWRAEHVERVDIVWDETLGLEGRAGYYDRNGALRDMIQNHLLQLLALVAMEPPIRMDERDLRDRKVQVLRAVATPTVEEVGARVTRARYGAGTIAGEQRPAYVDEPGVDPSRETETFVEVELRIENWRWAGVPFRLRTGKALAASRRFIEIRFRPVPHLAFGQPSEPRQNTLRLEMTPDRIVVGLDVNGPGDPFDLEPVDLEVSFARQRLSAYARLLCDVVRGDPVLAIRDDEIEESWRIVDPIVQAWRDGTSPLLEYAAGSAGPERRS